MSVVACPRVSTDLPLPYECIVFRDGVHCQTFEDGCVAQAWADARGLDLEEDEDEWLTYQDAVRAVMQPRESQYLSFREGLAKWEQRRREGQDFVRSLMQEHDLAPPPPLRDAMGRRLRHDHNHKYSFDAEAYIKSGKASRELVEDWHDPKAHEAYIKETMPVAHVSSLIDRLHARKDAPLPEKTRVQIAEDSPDEEKFANKIVRLVESECDLFHDQSGTTYAVISGRVVRLASPEMKSWIAGACKKTWHTVASPAAIDEARLALDACARFDRDARGVHVRVAEHEGAIYVDLGDEAGAYVEVTRDGWTVRDGVPPVMFRRPGAMRPLARPVRGGTLAELRPFVNAADDDAHHLFAAWLVAAFRPGRPFPILAIHGEQGTAKSTACRVARDLVDPNKSPLRTLPRSEDDLIVAAVHSHVVSFDNLSGVQPWLSDALCRLATGGGLSKRTLYADDAETVIEAIRPIVVNGIDDVATRHDLADRCLVLRLDPIAKGKRRDEASFWRAFDDASPRILGVLLDGVASALRGLDGVDVPELPRMADFAKWIVAAEPGLGLAKGTLLAAYERNIASVVKVAIDASPLASAVQALLTAPHPLEWKGTAGELLDELNRISPMSRVHRSWPSSSMSLPASLQRVAAMLRKVGVSVGYGERDEQRRRVWKLSRT